MRRLSFCSVRVTSCLPWVQTRKCLNRHGSSSAKQQLVELPPTEVTWIIFASSLRSPQWLEWRSVILGNSTGSRTQLCQYGALLAILYCSLTSCSNTVIALYS